VHRQTVGDAVRANIEFSSRQVGGVIPNLGGAGAF
jgi:hypothetical protein